MHTHHIIHTSHRHTHETNFLILMSDNLITYAYFRDVAHDAIAKHGDGTFIEGATVQLFIRCETRPEEGECNDRIDVDDDQTHEGDP